MKAGGILGPFTVVPKPHGPTLLRGLPGRIDHEEPAPREVDRRGEALERILIHR
jgi:hypothetical protein